MPALHRSKLPPNRPVTVERIENALILMARIVDLHGPKYLPLLERLERELVAAREKDRGVERARRILETYEREKRVEVEERMAGERVGQ